VRYSRALKRILAEMSAELDRLAQEQRFRQDKGFEGGVGWWIAEGRRIATERWMRTLEASEALIADELLHRPEAEA
jgi:hypothetical protein